MSAIYMTTEMQVRPIEELKPYENNARVHDEEQIAELCESIRVFGFVRPLLITGDGGVLCGHGRLEAAKRLGMPSLPCVLADHMTSEQRAAYILADNRLAEHAKWDKAMVSAELIRLRDAGFAISVTGFGEDDIILDLPREPFEDGDFDPEPQESERLPSGSLWRMGDHRLLVGDATVAADVERLMAGAAADLLLTDPPYDVDYEGGTSEALKIENDDLEPEAFLTFLKAAFLNARNAMRPGAAFYIWHPDGEPALEFRRALRDVRLPVRECLVWIKNSLVISRQDYHWQHEPCLAGRKPDKIFESCAYGWRSDAAHEWHSDRKQSTVLEFDRPTKSLEHPTMKPVKLFAYQIGNSTVQGDRVLDLFAGSGTTVIACEELGRRAYVMEKDERYAAVILRRWETMTGRRAEEINA
jgi:site-specific DNA-methyltransferase (adenine-specific)